MIAYLNSAHYFWNRRSLFGVRYSSKAFYKQKSFYNNTR